MAGFDGPPLTLEQVQKASYIRLLELEESLGRELATVCEHLREIELKHRKLVRGVQNCCRREAIEQKWSDDYAMREGYLFRRRLYLKSSLQMILTARPGPK